jgi:hypothetical protein
MIKSFQRSNQNTVDACSSFFVNRSSLGISDQYGRTRINSYIISRHPSSTLTHEAGVAVLQLAPDRFWDFSKKLFDQQTEFFDVNVVNETRNATYRRLAKIAASVDLDEKKVYELLEISDKPGKDGSLNTGNAVTNDLKVLVKMNRLTGVHVTPTVLFNVSNIMGISNAS